MTNNHLHISLTGGRPCVVDQPDDCFGQGLKSSIHFRFLEQFRPRVEENGNDHVRSSVFEEKRVVNKHTCPRFVS